VKKLVLDEFFTFGQTFITRYEII